MADLQNTKNPYYPDVTLFLVLIPFISAFNYYLTYSNIQLNGFLLLTFTIDTVQGYCAWWGVRTFILFLDKKLPYEKGLGRRIFIQLFSTLIIGLFIISILTELVSLIAKGKPAPLHFYTKDLFIISIWFFCNQWHLPRSSLLSALSGIGSKTSTCKSNQIGWDFCKARQTGHPVDV
jgi:hypothetical protein